MRKTATTDLEFTRGTTRSGSGPGTPQEHGGGLIVRQDMHLKYVAVGDPGGCREGNNKTRHLTSDCMFYELLYAGAILLKFCFSVLLSLQVSDSATLLNRNEP